MTDQLLIETAERALGAVASFDAIQAAEQRRWAPEIWDAVAEIGLPWISVPESAGGVGGTLSEAVAVLVIAGRHAAPIPLAETGLLGGWLLAAGGLEVGEGALSVVPGRAEDDLHLEGGLLSGSAHRVPWAGQVERIAALVEGQIVVLRPEQGQIVELSNLAGEPRDTIRFSGIEPEAVVPAPAGIDADALRFRGALSRAALMAGALQAMCELTVAYSSERKQFGKAIGSFQAVQALLVRVGEEAALVDLAVQVAALEAERAQFSGQPVGRAIAIGKVLRHGGNRGNLQEFEQPLQRGALIGVDSRKHVFERCHGCPGLGRPSPDRVVPLRF